MSLDIRGASHNPKSPQGIALYPPTSGHPTPDERHWGREHDILARRHRLYQRVRNAHPERWTGSTRNWTPVEAVLLNPPHGIC